MLLVSSTHPPLWLAAVALGACSGGGPTAWQDHMGAWFNNGSVQPPEPAPNRWTRRDWDMFQKRIGHADVAVVGTVKVLGTFGVFKTPKQVRLSFRPTLVLHGSIKDLVDEQGVLALTIHPGDDDFYLALRAQRHVPGRSYLLFIKYKARSRAARPPPGWKGSLWRPPAKAKRPIRWVMYRPDRPVIKRARLMYQWLKSK